MLNWPSSRRGRGALVAALLAVQTVPALADRDPQTGAPFPPDTQEEIPSPITDRFYIEGIFYPFSTNTDLRLDPSQAETGVTTGTPLNAERDLGLVKRLYQGRVELMFRLRQRSRIWVDFEDVSRSASHLLSRDIQFGNEFFPAGQQVDTMIGWRIFTLAYTYSVFRNDWLEVGVGAAANLIEAEVRGQVAALDELEDVSTAEVLPAIPVEFAWRFARRFSLTGRAQYLDASVGGFSGSFADLHGDVQYRWTANFAVGVGYTLERIDAEVHSGNYPGLFDTEVKGEEAFFRMSF